MTEYATPRSVTRSCHLLGMHPATYHRHQNRKHHPRPDPWAAVKAAIIRHHEETQGRCGRRDMHAWLRREGIMVSYEKCHKLMQELEIRAVRGTRHRPKAQGINNEAVAMPNLLWEADHPRDFSSAIPGTRLVGDCTEFVWHRRGKHLYLHVVMDLYHRGVMGWALSDKPDAISALAAMEMARNQGAFRTNVIFHSDHGSQYMSNRFRDYCQLQGIRQSMGAKRVCYDNAVAESFFATLKGDLPDIKTFATKQDLAVWVVTWIEGWYNSRRPHSWNRGYPPFSRPPTIEHPICRTTP
ncbi:MAG: IS3 family transposase [Thermomicrobiales bacterium]|nr:IS3 family transposase [Thermomicrobiales bacterium]MCO5216890.1 IS3 family transposase [Thermomicrobiales bacterium]MCO5218835.1 IS3 family transposase [Thermomicrobiales bacterium]MCO5218863.1 IS3 family transposase [Thermomicrobiales bacterium]MCO5218993.1 IS3 family transposase [Thermomicrobiales bacterium]